ncbi:MAG: CHAT domain-containing protein [Anaerolineae bacterium]|nr:CHAT domain-containing protein [Anaerolineae bacterium]
MNNKLRKDFISVLSGCDELQSDESLKELFSEEALSFFREKLRQANRTERRIAYLIEDLERLVYDGKPVLATFLNVIIQRYDSRDNRYSQLQELLHRLQKESSSVKVVGDHNTVGDGSIFIPPSHNNSKAIPISQNELLIAEPIKLYAAAPKQAEVGSAFRVAVQIRMPSTGPLEVEELNQVASADGQIFRSDEKDIVRYRVQLAATNCDVVGSSMFEFLLKQGQNSNLQNFMLQPRNEGTVLITVNAYQADTNLLAASTFSQVKVVVVTNRPTLTRSQLPDDEITTSAPLENQDLVELLKNDTLSPAHLSTALIKILFAAANPTNTTKLRLGKEFDEIKAELERGGKRDKVTLALPQLATRGIDLSRALLQEIPTIVHFSGHGEKNGAIYFETDNGNSNMVSAETLGALFEVFEGQVQCVILNACYSATQAQAIAKHIPYVIGMNRAIPDTHAIAFSIGFYQAIANGATIEKAYALGKVQIGLS